jgi:hypothetical protein
MHSAQNIVEDAQIQEEAAVLEGPGDPPAGDLKGGQAHYVISPVFDAALGGPIDPGQKIEKGRFPGTVGPDQAHGLAAPDPEFHLVDRGQPTELDGQVPGC